MSVSIICVYWLTKSTDFPSQDDLFGGNGHFEVWDLDPLFHHALSIDSPSPASGLPAWWAPLRREILDFFTLVCPLIHTNATTTILSVWSPIFTWVCLLRGSQALRACSWWWPPPPPRPPASQVWKRTIFNPVIVFVWFSAVVGDFVSHQFCPAFCFPESFHCLKWFLVFPTCTLLQSLFQGHLHEPNWYIS